MKGHGESRMEKLQRLAKRKSGARKYNQPFLRAENEDDDGYDPYSDREPEQESLFKEHPWQ